MKFKWKKKAETILLETNTGDNWMKRGLLKIKSHRHGFLVWGQVDPWVMGRWMIISSEIFLAMGWYRVDFKSWQLKHAWLRIKACDDVLDVIEVVDQ